MKTIIALDFNTQEESLEFLDKISIEKLAKYANNNGYKFFTPYVKVGMWQYYTAGNDFLKRLKNLGFKIFLDLKLIDIPNTIYNASKTLLKNDIDILSLHSNAGKRALEAAVLAKNELNSKCELFAISVLTSFSNTEFEDDLGIKMNIIDYVKQRCKISKEAGVDGVVSSVYEANIAQNFKLKTLCPGIRFNNSEKNDQNRIANPKIALENNIDYIVAGRIITTSKNPINAYFKCLQGEENE